MFSMELFLNKNGCSMDLAVVVDCEWMLKAKFQTMPPCHMFFHKKHDNSFLLNYFLQGVFMLYHPLCDSNLSTRNVLILYLPCQKYL